MSPYKNTDVQKIVELLVKNGLITDTTNYAMLENGAHTLLIKAKQIRKEKQHGKKRIKKIKQEANEKGLLTSLVDGGGDEPLFEILSTLPAFYSHSRHAHD